MSYGRKISMVLAVGVLLAGAGVLALGVRTDSVQAATGDSYLGSVDIVGFNFAPRSWALCDGQLLSISSNSALFSLLGTTYGGDGRTTFGLPDLRGRTPIHMGTGPGLSSRSLGAKGGTETNTLNVTQIPSHNHSATATTSATATLRANGVSESANSPDPDGRLLAHLRTRLKGFGPVPAAATDYVDMHASSIDLSVGATVTVGNTGGNQYLHCRMGR